MDNSLVLGLYLCGVCVSSVAITISLLYMSEIQRFDKLHTALTTANALFLSHAIYQIFTLNT